MLSFPLVFYDLFCLMPICLSYLSSNKRSLWNNEDPASSTPTLLLHNINAGGVTGHIDSMRSSPAIVRSGRSKSDAWASAESGLVVVITRQKSRLVAQRRLVELHMLVVTALFGPYHSSSSILPSLFFYHNMSASANSTSTLH